VKVLILWLMNGWLAWLTLLGLCILILFLLYGFFLWTYKKEFGRWASCGLSPRALLKSFLRARAGGRAWWPVRDHVAVAVVALAIAAWGAVRSAASGDVSDFSRSGSLITLLGLLSAVVGLAHARGLTEARSAVNKEKAAQEKPSNAELADKWSRPFTAFVLILGTVIWGYGDLALTRINKLFCPAGASWVQLECSAKTNPPSLPPRRRLVLFDWNSTALRPAAEEIIIEAALDAKKDANPLVCVVGHADASGPPKYNSKLSEDRANVVKAELLKLGLSCAEVKVSAKGSTDLLVPSPNEPREILNRNVEIIINPGSASTQCR